MRILVFSDSHGNSRCMSEALYSNPNAEMIIHLGDGERDLNDIGDAVAGRKIIQICGNCDLYSLLPTNELVTADGVKIFCTHGFAEQVKSGNSVLISKAKEAGARIALYGHTHKAVTDYRDGLYIMNPGSIRSGDYGAIDITEKGIYLSLLEV